MPITGSAPPATGAMVVRNNLTYTQNHNNTTNNMSQAYNINNNNNNNSGSYSPTDQFPVQSLLHLQRRIADCFQDAHRCFIDMPEVAAQVCCISV